MNNKAEAKKIFFDYACRHFHMDRDGIGEVYKKFGISEAEEAVWRQEYISFWRGQLSADNVEAIKKLGNALASEALPDLIKLAGQGDSYIKLWCAIEISSLISLSGAPSTLQEQAQKTVIDLWQSLAQGPIELSDNHQKKITSTMMKFLGASTPEEYISNYAKRALPETQ